MAMSELPAGKLPRYSPTASEEDLIIRDAQGNRIGFMTEFGPVFGASPGEMAEIEAAVAENERCWFASLGERARVSREGRMKTLRDIAEVSPQLMIDRLDQLTFDERKLLQYALTMGDSVNLPYCVQNVIKTREHRGRTKHAVEVAMHRASRRLYNRGLGTVEKRDDGLIWFSVSRERLLSAIRRDIEARRPPGAEHINLMKVPCEIQTFDSEGNETTPLDAPKADPTDLPKRCSSYRRQACRLMTGIRTLSREDKSEINYLFDCYLDDINEKIIALLDTRTGEVIGSEYSTRYNDLAKAAKSMNKFDWAMDQSLQRYYHAVFLTLTTNPNFTDEELVSNNATELAKIEKALADPYLKKRQRDKLMRGWYHRKGPDFEISDLTERLRTEKLNTRERRIIEERLQVLEEQRIASIELYEKLKDPRLGIRERERTEQQLKKFNRWRYSHDPNGFTNIWEANRSFAPAWNRFMSYIQKMNKDADSKKGVRPEYIAAFEYTESGLLHIHAIIFVRYLMPQDAISREWLRCGQGEIVHVYGLQNVLNRSTGKREWRWKRGSPEGGTVATKTPSGGDYLKKYVKKCMFAMMDEHSAPSNTYSLYWTFNKRMYTNSRSLLDGFDGQRVEVGEILHGPDSPYRFYLVVGSEQAETVVDRMVYHRIRPDEVREAEPLEAAGPEEVPA